MVKSLKKVLEMFRSKKETIKLNDELFNNDDLLNDLKSLYENPNLDDILLNPNCKICVLNTYTPNFYELLNKIHRKHNATTLVAVNLHSYFKNSPLALSEGLMRISKYAEKNQIASTLVHDLYEIIETLKYLTDITE